MVDMTPDVLTASERVRALAEMTTEEAGRNEGRLRAYLRGAADALAVAEDEQDDAVPIRSDRGTP